LLIVPHKELVLEIVGERRRTTSGDLGGIFGFLMATPLAIGVPSFMLTALDTGFSIDSDAVLANHEELSPKT
jgi:hypothetical protein